METLRRLREARGMTQEALAEVAGVDRSAISHYERGEDTPRLSVALAIANALGVSVHDIEFAGLSQAGSANVTGDHNANAAHS